MECTRKFACAALLLSTATFSASAFKITWTGNADGTDFFNEGNWVSALTQLPPPAGAVNPANPFNQIIDLTGTTQTVNASAGPITIGSTGLMQVNGVTLTTASTIRRDNDPATNNNANAALIISNAPSRTASVTALGLVEIDVALINLLTLTDAIDPLKFSTVSFSASQQADATLHLTGESVASVIAEHLSKFTVGGTNVPAVIGSNPALAEPGDNLRILSDGGTGSIITPILYTVVPADLDGDGDVDDADFGIAFSAFTGPGGVTNSPADLDGDNDVDDADFGIAFASFTGPGSPVTVPEPASLAVLAGLSLLSLNRRRMTY